MMTMIKFIFIEEYLWMLLGIVKNLRHMKALFHLAQQVESLPYTSIIWWIAFFKFFKFWELCLVGVAVVFQYSDTVRHMSNWRLSTKIVSSRFFFEPDCVRLHKKQHLTSAKRGCGRQMWGCDFFMLPFTLLRHHRTWPLTFGEFMTLSHDKL